MNMTSSFRWSWTLSTVIALNYTWTCIIVKCVLARMTHKSSLHDPLWWYSIWICPHTHALIQLSLERVFTNISSFSTTGSPISWYCVKACWTWQGKAYWKLFQHKPVYCDNYNLPTYLICIKCFLHCVVVDHKHPCLVSHSKYSR